MKLGLVLSGGGANGAFTAGVVGALEEAGIAPTVLSGTSAGALNAAGMAVGMDAATLADLWTSIDGRDVFRARRDVHRLLRPQGWLSGGNVAERLLEGVGWNWLLETAPLRRTLVRMLGGERLEVRPDRTLAVSAVEMGSGELVRFASAPPPPHRMSARFRVTELTVDHLMASAAIPLAFRPAELDGELWWDGGLVANTPLAPALAYEPDAVIVVTTSTRERPSPPPETLGQSLSLLIDNVLAHSLHADLERAKVINELCRVAPERTDRREVSLLVVEATGLDLGSSLDFDPELAQRRLELGVRAGRRALAGWDGALR
jgi:NTE family protein